MNKINMIQIKITKRFFFASWTKQHDSEDHMKKVRLTRDTVKRKKKRERIMDHEQAGIKRQNTKIQKNGPIYKWEFSIWKR